MMRKKNQGFILVLTTIILSIGLLIVSRLIYKGSIHIAFDRTMINLEKAKLLSLSGVQIAMSQLTVKTTSTTNSSPEKTSVVLNEFLEKIFINLNRWQKIILKEDIDGVEGDIHICITSENGKIPLNAIFDREKKKFINEGAPQGDLKKSLQALFAAMKKFTKDKDLFDIFEKILKQRQYKFNDVTELLTNAEFEKIFKSKIFYDPPSLETAQQEGGFRPLYLADIFTVFSETKLEPWLLSDSLQAILMLRRAQLNDTKQRAEEVKQLLKEKSINQIGSIQELWDNYLQRFYGRDFKSISNEITSLFTLKFEPLVFSVLSYGIVGGITQKTLAIIEKIKSSENNTFIIKKMYWL